MASESKRVVKKIRYDVIHRWMAGVALLAFFVTIGAGLQAQVSVMTVTYRATLVVVLVSIIGRVIMKVIATYEELNSGEA